MDQAQEAKRFAVTMRKVREEKGMTLSQLSEKTGISATALWQLESGDLVPRIETVRRVANGLDVSINLFTKVKVTRERVLL